MRHFKIVGVALLAVFALTAVMASSASALILPLLELPQKTFKGESKAATTLTAAGGTAITCLTATAEGTEVTSSLGDIHIHFNSCKTGTQPCNSKGDTKELILALLLWHFVYDKFSKTVNDTEANLGVAILFLVGLGSDSDINIECAAGTVKVVVLGLVLCLIKEYKIAALSHTFKCEAEKEKQLEKEWFNKEDKEPNNAVATLLCSVNGATEKECSQAGEGTFETKEKVKIAG